MFEQHDSIDKNIGKEMTENLLQFIWQHRLYSIMEPLQSSEGETILVLHPGRLNTHAGPDFLEAKIKINNTLWAGNIEVHVKSSDWLLHQHQKDENYDKLILHVVYIEDAPIRTAKDSLFPTLVLKTHIEISLLDRYARLMESNRFIPCENSISSVSVIKIQTQLERMLAERLEDKTNNVAELLALKNNNWQEVFYIQLARGFGLHINQDAFEKLALQTPLHLFEKYKNNQTHIEALLFGQAGFLSDYFDETYPNFLHNEYQYLKKLHQLEPISTHMWKFLRLRPANFPTIRLAQFAQLIFQSTHLFSKIMNAATLKELESLFDVEVAGYWLNHYTFRDESTEKKKHLGKSFIHTLVSNAVVPTLFIYGKLQGNNAFCDKAIDFLHQLPAETNHIIRRWESTIGVVKNAAETQALLQLHKKYCTPKKCLSCSIGYEILKYDDKS